MHTYLGDIVQGITIKGGRQIEVILMELDLAIVIFILKHSVSSNVVCANI